MKLGFFALAALLLCGSAVAQDRDHKSKTTVIVEDGKEMTVTGCVERSRDGSGYMLTNAAGKDGAVGSYLLAESDDEDDLEDLDKHVGHRIEVTGKAADRGNGKIKVETKNEVRKGDAKAKTESKSEVKGDLSGLPYLGIKSFRMIATVCP
jgi:hypothetical protein